MPVVLIVVVAVVVLLVIGSGALVATRSHRRRGGAAGTSRGGQSATSTAVRAAGTPVLDPEASGTAAISAPATEAEAPPERPALRDRLGKARLLLGGYLGGIRGR